MWHRTGGFKEKKPWRQFETKAHRRKRRRRICLLGILSAVIWGNILGPFELVPKIASETFFEEGRLEGYEVFGIRLRIKEGTVEFYRKTPLS